MPKKSLQSGEIEAEATELSAQTIGVQLAEIHDKSEREKIPLSKEVEEYTRANLRKVQEKLAKGEPVYPSDMEFIEKVMLWISMPQTWREKYVSIEEMDASFEVQEVVKEAKQRDIDLKQWAVLMMMAGLKAERGEEIKWIEDLFKFPGNKKIVVNGGLNLRDCTGLTVLPDNLHVSEGLILSGCTGLKVLPGNLHVDGGLILGGCTGLTALPGNLHVDGGLFLDGCIGLNLLPDNLYVGGYMQLSGCTGLTALPENLKVNGYLNLIGCTGLTALPENLKVNGALQLNGCIGLNLLPDNLKVAESLNLTGCTGFTALPDNLHVAGFLDLSGCTGLKVLPDNLRVDGGLDLDDCTGLTALPDNLRVAGDLYISKSAARKLKRDVQRLKKLGNISGEIKYL